MKKKKNRMSWSFYCIFAILTLYSISLLIPLIWGLITSLKSPDEFLIDRNLTGLPSIEKSLNEIKLGNYRTLLKSFQLKRSIVFYGICGAKIQHVCDAGIFEILGNTFIYCIGGAVILTIVPCVVAYLVSKYKFKFSAIIYGIAMFAMIIPTVGSYPAEIALLRQLNLYDNLLGNLLQKCHFLGSYFFVFAAFFSSMSNGYEEAAEIDGASQFQTMVRIVLPLSSKILGTVFLLEVIMLWNDYQTPLLYLPTHPTFSYAVQYMVFNMSQGAINNTPVKVSACMLLAIPMLILFIILKDKIMGSVSMGGLKE